MRRSFDLDDLYMEYADLVEAGDIDETKVSAEEYVTDRYSDLCSDAYDAYKASYQDP